MSRFLSLALLMSISLCADEITDFISSSENLVDKQEAISFLRGLQEEATSKTEAANCKKCLSKNVQTDQQTIDETVSIQNLYVFISFSVPVESWKDLSTELESTNGCFVLKGVPENSFQLFSEKVMELRASGIAAPIQINPELFGKYGIEAVPAIVLDGEASYDKVIGNIRLRKALEIFSEKGSNKGKAFTIMKGMKLSQSETAYMGNAP